MQQRLILIWLLLCLSMLFLQGCWTSEDQLIDTEESVNPWGDARFVIATPTDVDSNSPGFLLRWTGTQFRSSDGDGDEYVRFTPLKTGLSKYFSTSEYVMTRSTKNGYGGFFVIVKDDSLQLQVPDNALKSDWFSQSVTSLGELRDQIRLGKEHAAFDTKSLDLFVEIVNSTRAAQHQLVIEEYRRQRDARKANRSSSTTQSSAADIRRTLRASERELVKLSGANVSPDSPQAIEVSRRYDEIIARMTRAGSATDAQDVTVLPEDSEEVAKLKRIIATFEENGKDTREARALLRKLQKNEQELREVNRAIQRTKSDLASVCEQIVEFMPTYLKTFGIENYLNVERRNDFSSSCPQYRRPPLLVDMTANCRKARGLLEQLSRAGESYRVSHDMKRNCRLLGAPLP